MFEYLEHMANDETCEACGGDGVLIGDIADAHGERTDDVQPCSDCSAAELDYPDKDEDGERAHNRRVDLERLYGVEL